jgi:hypothetical protein
LPWALICNAFGVQDDRDIVPDWLAFLESTVYAILRPLFVGVGCRPILLVAALLPLGVAWQVLGNHYGAAGLIWHGDWLVQALAGLGITLLFGQVCFVAYLLDSSPHHPHKLRRPASKMQRFLFRRARMVRDCLTGLMSVIVAGRRATRCDPLSWRSLQRYLALTWLPLLAVLVLPSILYPSTEWPWTGDRFDYTTTDQGFGRTYWSEEGPWVFGLSNAWCLVITLPQRWPLLLGVATALAVSRVFALGFLRLGEPHTPWLAANLPTRIAGSWWQLCLHAILFAVCAILFWMLTAVVPTVGQCFLLALWLAAHGSVIAVFGIADDVDSAGLWKHVLAGLAFGGAFLLYEALLLLYWFSGGAGIAAYISPALVLCLGLALLVMVHGFLRFHFRVAYPVVGLTLLVAVVCVNSLVEVKHELPGLSRSDVQDGPRPLWRADAPALAIAYMEAEKDRDDLRAVANRDPGRAEALLEAEQALKEAREDLVQFYRGFRARFDSQVASFAKAGWPTRAAPPEPKKDTAPTKEITDLRNRLLDLETQRLRVWKQQAAPDGSKPTLAVAAVSGGASRAAMWTAFVLTELERSKKLSGFPRHLRVIAGASGGMVGAAHYTATLQGAAGHGFAARALQKGPDNQLHEVFGDATAKAFADQIAQDHLTPVMQRLLFVDVPGSIIPRTADTDRGRALEESWQKHSGHLQRTFTELAVGEAEGWRPSLIFSPMLVEGGQRLLISNLYLTLLTEASGSMLSEKIDQPPAPAPPRTGPGKPAKMHLQKDLPKGKRTEYRRDKQADDRTRYSVSAVELFSLFPQVRGQLKVATAARMSATFPYVSPAADLPTEPHRHAVDAGYFDNYGVAVAAAWIFHNREWLAANTSGVVLIQIRDQASLRRQLYAETERDQWSLARGIEWLTGPLTGAGSAFESMMVFRSDEELQGLNDYFGARGGKNFFTTVVFECQEEISLNWYLSEAEKKHLLNGFNGYQESNGSLIRSGNEISLRNLEQWWATRNRSP